MNIQYFREFIVLAQCLSFTEASHELNITQPALSKHVLMLEKEFDTVLMDRTRKSAQLTEAGRVLFENAGSILSIYDNMKETIAALKIEKPIHVAGHLNDPDIVSFSSTITMLARDKYHTAIVFNCGTAVDTLKSVEDGIVDLFVGYVNLSLVQKAGLCSQPYTVSNLVAIVNTSHPLAEKESVRWEDLRNETFIKFMSAATSPAWEQIEEVCTKHGFIPKTRPIFSQNPIIFFSTPLSKSILVWKKSQKEVGMLLETGHRASIPIVDDDAVLISYAVYKPENIVRLQGFFNAAEEVKGLLDIRKTRRQQALDN